MFCTAAYFDPNSAPGDVFKQARHVDDLLQTYYFHRPGAWMLRGSHLECYLEQRCLPSDGGLLHGRATGTGPTTGRLDWDGARLYENDADQDSSLLLVTAPVQDWTVKQKLDRQVPLTSAQAASFSDLSFNCRGPPA